MLPKGKEESQEKGEVNEDCKFSGHAHSRRIVKNPKEYNVKEKKPAGGGGW